MAEAEEVAKHALVEQWKKHFGEDWRAIATYMERRWPDEFGRRERINIDHSGEVTHAEKAMEEQLKNDPESRDMLKSLFEKHIAFMNTKK